MKKVRNEIDLSDWVFDLDQNALEEAMQIAVAAALREALEDDHNFSAYLAWAWHRRTRPDDPLTIYITLPFGNIDSHPIWSFSLLDCIDSAIENYGDWEPGERPTGAKVDDRPENLIAIRDALRAAAQLIDDVLPEEVGE
jgi:hypothetical protein